MNALEFLKERDRMCSVYSGKGYCAGCPLEGMHCMTVEPLYDDSYEKVINTVEQWSKEHPRKTRQSVFLEQWPDACVDSNGVLTICPMAVSADYRTKTGECKHPDVKCFECEYKFWMQEA